VYDQNKIKMCNVTKNATSRLQNNDTQETTVVNWLTLVKT